MKWKAVTVGVQDTGDLQLGLFKAIQPPFLGYLMLLIVSLLYFYIERVIQRTILA